MRAPAFPDYYTLADKAGWWALRVFGALVLAFLLLPILVVMPLSLSASSFLVYPMPGWSLQWYQNLFTSNEWARAAKNSFIVAPSATVIATALGTLTAVGLARVQFAGKGLLMSVLIAPMVVPIVVVAVATYLFFAPIGLADSCTGLIVVHAALGAPFVVTLFLAGPEQVTLPRQMFTGIRENINPTIAAVATLLTIFTTALMLVLEWIRGRRA